MRHFCFRYLSRSSQISLSFVSDISHVSFQIFSQFCSSIYRKTVLLYIYINKVYSIIPALLYPFAEAYFTKKSFFSQKSLVVIIFCYTFALAFTASSLSVSVNKASFFEKIYINREVVQEASVAIRYSIRWVKETSQLIYYRCINLILLDNQF